MILPLIVMLTRETSSFQLPACYFEFTLYNNIKYNCLVHLTKLVTFLNKICIFVVTNYNNVSFFR